jgi:hypothetical protein
MWVSGPRGPFPLLRLPLLPLCFGHETTLIVGLGLVIDFIAAAVAYVVVGFGFVFF